MLWCPSSGGPIANTEPMTSPPSSKASFPKQHQIRRFRPSRWWSRIIIAIAATAVAWRILRYALFPIWGDEAFLAWNLFVRDFAGMFKPLEYNQIAPVGFMWIELAVTRVLGTSDHALRLFPFLCMQNEFSIDTMADNHVTLYESVLNG